MMYWTNGGWWMMGLGWIFMVSIWALVILAVVAMLRWLGMPWGGRGGTQHKTPLDILKERYARGEIDREEYEQKRRDLAL